MRVGDARINEMTLSMALLWGEKQISKSEEQDLTGMIKLTCPC
jgi:hypothetical protein